MYGMNKFLLHLDPQSPVPLPQQIAQPFQAQVPGPRLPLGALADVAYEAAMYQLLPAEALLMFSDGLPEARRPSGEQLGYEDLVEILRQMRMSAGSARSSEARLEDLLAVLRQITTPTLEDDWTAVVMEDLEARLDDSGETR